MGVRPAGTATFLFTDIEDSTRLWDESSDLMSVALVRHDEIIRSAIEGHGGFVFTIGGDGFGAAFARADDAVSAAVDAQRSLSVEGWPEQLPLRVRMGVHTGEAVERDGNYYGPPVNRAARIMGTANGGQVVVSSLTAALLERSVDIEMIDLGSVRLKGVADLIQVFGVRADGLAWIDRPLVSVQTTAGNLPRLHDEGVGDLATLQARVSRLSRTRLVTLTGSGGVGKTRAAIEIGWLSVDEFRDGVWLFELAPIADPDAVIAAAASMFSIQPEAGVRLVDSVVDWCAGRRMLLIVDNCEHVLDPVIDLVSAIVAACPTVTIVATSREPLGLPGELVERVVSLTAEVGVELFIARATAADTSFSPTPVDHEAISTICSRLDGIPLAIELAAGRIRSLSPTEILDRLDDRFRLLRGGRRSGLERHQTMRAAVSWSYQLLSDAERVLFDRLSVFAGGFDLLAAEVVCLGDEIDDVEVFDLLAELVDKSMVIAERSEHATRYRLLETLRSFGEQHTEHRDDIARLRGRHLGHYLVQARRADEQWWSPEQLEADAWFDREWDNLRAAHTWATTSGDFEASRSLVDSTYISSMMRMRREHGEWTNRTLELGERASVCTSEIYAAAAGWATVAADNDRWYELISRGLELEPYGPCRAGRAIGLAFTSRSDSPETVADLRTAMELDPRPRTRYWTLIALALVEPTGPQAGSIIEEMVANAEQVGAPAPIASAVRFRGQYKMASGLPGAEEDFRSAVAIGDSVRNVAGTCWARYLLAEALIAHRDPGASGALRDALARSYDARFWTVANASLHLCARYLNETGQRPRAAPIREHLGLRVIRSGGSDADETANGATMNRHEIVAYALAQLDTE
jgi:predicted ATPase/class 3 adenylate cyclase